MITLWETLSRDYRSCPASNQSGQLSPVFCHAMFDRHRVRLSHAPIHSRKVSRDCKTFALRHFRFQVPNLLGLKGNFVTKIFLEYRVRCCRINVTIKTTYKLVKVNLSLFIFLLCLCTTSEYSCSPEDSIFSIITIVNTLVTM